MRWIALTIVVLPMSGPPTMTEPLEENATQTASAGPGRQGEPGFPFHMGQGLVRAAPGPWGLADRDPRT